LEHRRITRRRKDRCFSCSAAIQLGSLRILEENASHDKVQSRRVDARRREQAFETGLSVAKAMYFR
jgi:hypothetical protein